MINVKRHILKKINCIIAFVFIFFIFSTAVNAANTGTNWSKDDIITIYQPTSGGAFYPRLVKLSNGNILCAFDTNEDGTGFASIKVVKSTDGGTTWGSKVTIASATDRNCATPMLYQFSSGEIWCGYRTSYLSGTVWYTEIRIKSSTDGGTTWSDITNSTVASETSANSRYGGVWEPHIGIASGQIVVMYCNDGDSITTDGSYQHILLKTRNGTSWSAQTVVSNPTNSRDGMPVWCQMADGRYIAVFESTDITPSAFGIKYKISSDGLNWVNEPRQVLYTAPSYKVCNAPFVTLLSDGRLMASFQTDESNVIADGDDGATVKTMLAVADDDGSITWTDKYFAYPTPFNKWSSMISLLVPSNRTVFIACSSNYPNNGIYLRKATLDTPLTKTLVNNWGFEIQNYLGWDYYTGWGTDMTIRGINTGDARCTGGGNYFMRVQNDVYLGQNINGLDNGTYSLSAYIRSSGGQPYCYMEVKDYGGTTKTYNITAKSTWTKITISNISVTAGKALVGFFVDSNSTSQYLDVDNVSLQASATTTVNKLNNFSFECASMYGWDYPGGTWGTNVILCGENNALTAAPGGGDHFIGVRNDNYIGQTVTGLVNGTYTAKAYVRKSGGQAFAYMEAINYGGSQLKTDIPTTSAWTEITINNIYVTNNQAIIGFYIDSTDSNQTCDIDNVRLYKN
jgi:hypothetical protein